LILKLYEKVYRSFNYNEKSSAKLTEIQDFIIDMEKKIINFSNVEKILKPLKKNGKKIVHCHGVFDLLHLGHVKHFKSAKKYGDILIVSVTPDKFVSKGSNRPYFNSDQRMEALASIEVIDFVVLNISESAIDIIKKIKPKYYCKGPDYGNFKENIKDKINNKLLDNFINEKKICKKIGCEIKFTYDKKFSSSKIINEKLFYNSNDELNFLRTIKKKYTFFDIKEAVDNLSKFKFLVVGDPIIDTYFFSDSMGISSKSSIISTQLKFQENYLGGSLAVAEMLTKLGCKVELLAYKSKNRFFNDKLKLLNKKINLLSTSNQKSLPRISRFIHINRNEKLFQFYEFDQFIHNKKSISKFFRYLLNKKKENYKVIIIDFGFGFLNKNIIKKLEKKISGFSLNVHANSLNSNYNKYSKYKKYNYLTMNLKEFQLGLNTSENDVDTLINKSNNRIINYPYAVTLGVKGSVLIDKKQKKIYSPSFFKKTVDTVGAGDAYFAVTSALINLKIDHLLTSFIGNVYAGLHSLQIGNKKFVNKEELLNSIYTILNE